MIRIDILPIRKKLILIVVLYMMAAGFATVFATTDIPVLSADGTQSGVIPVRVIAGVEMISLIRWADLVDAEMEWDFVTGVAEMRFRDHRLRFVDSGRGVLVNGRMQSLPAAVRQLDGDIWVPVKILDDLVDPLWEGDLIWNRLEWTLSRFGSPPGGKSTGFLHEDGSIVIVLDPGHGGTDTGCIHQNGAVEKDIALKLAVRVSEILMNRLGAHVVLTRSSDGDVALDQRVSEANRSGADLFISIHLAPPQEMPGKSFCIWSLPDEDDPGDSSGGLSLWENRSGDVIQRTRSFGQRFSEGMALTATVHEFSSKTAQLSGLKGLTMPGFIVELSWDSTYYGQEKITEDSGRNRAAEAIFDGIKGCLEAE